MNKRLYSIRGATCTENTRDSIMACVKELCKEIFSKNAIKSEDLVNIHFTMTPDLDVLNPAFALRNSDVGIDTSKVPLFTSQEVAIKGMLAKVIRVMITVYLEEGTSVVPVYINGAQVLRPDFCADNTK